MKDFLRLPALDVRILAAVALGLIMAPSMVERGAARKSRHPSVARGAPDYATRSLALSPDGRWIATSSVNTTNGSDRVTLRAWPNGTPIERCLEFPGTATTLAFSPDSLLLAVAGLEPVVCLWDIKGAYIKPVSIIHVSVDRVRHLVFAPDGKSIAIATDRDGTILIWDLDARRPRTVLHQSSPARSVVFSRDGRRLASAGVRHDWSIVLSDLQTGERRIMRDHGFGPVSSLAFSPDGAILASTSFTEPFIRLWDIKTGFAPRTLARHARSVNSVAFSPDGKFVATAANDHAVGLWNVATGQRLVSLDGHANCLRTVAFSPDGRTLLLATEDDDDIRFWDVAELF